MGFFGKCARCRIDCDLTVISDEKLICEDCHREIKGADYAPPTRYEIRMVPYMGTIGDDGVIDAGDLEN